MHVCILTFMKPTLTASLPPAPLRRVLRRVTTPGRIMARDVLTCGHSVEVLRYAAASNGRRCPLCALPRVGAAELDVDGRVAANEWAPGGAA